MSPLAIVGVVCLAIGLASGWGGRALVADAELARLSAKHAGELTAQANDAQEREAAARAEERRVTRNVMEAADAANLKAADARRTAAAAAAERDRLRDAYRAAFAASGSAETPAAAASGPPATGAGLVFPRLFDRGADLLQSCAASLDQSRIAGLACERAYDAVSGYTPPQSTVE